MSEEARLAALHNLIGMDELQNPQPMVDIPALATDAQEYLTGDPQNDVMGPAAAAMLQTIMEQSGQGSAPEGWQAGAMPGGPKLPKAPITKPALPLQKPVKGGPNDAAKAVTPDEMANTTKSYLQRKQDRANAIKKLERTTKQQQKANSDINKKDNAKRDDRPLGGRENMDFAIDDHKWSTANNLIDAGPEMIKPAFKVSRPTTKRADLEVPLKEQYKGRLDPITPESAKRAKENIMQRYQKDGTLGPDSYEDANRLIRALYNDPRFNIPKEFVNSPIESLNKLGFNSATGAFEVGIIAPFKVGSP